MRTWIKSGILLFIGTILLAGCAPGTDTETVQVTRVVTETVTIAGDPVEVTRVVTETVVETVIVAPEPAPARKDLVICTGEPPSLYPLATRGMLVAVDVLHAIYEPNITSLSYGYQAVGLEKVPSLADGDAWWESVLVSSGDRVADQFGNPVLLEEGMVLLDSEGMPVTFDGTPLEVGQMVVEWTLKPRVWADGVPVTADDSVFAYELFTDPSAEESNYLAERTAAYTAVDERTVRWTAIPGLRESAYFTFFRAPLPRHILGEYPPAELVTLDIASRTPVGDGPFRVVEWVPADHILLEPNDHYYRRDEGLPYLDSVTFKFVDDSNQLLTQVLAGGCDFARMSVDNLPFLVTAEEQGLLTVQANGGTAYEHIDFGINSYGDYGDGAGRPDWFEDARVRQAITMCTNRQGMVEEILDGRSTVMHSYLPPSHPLYPPDITEWPYDPARANALLDDVGYLDSDGDGWREDPLTGAPFQISLITSAGSDLRQLTTQIFQANMIDCGINVQLTFVPVSELFAGGDDGGRLFGRQFDLGQFAWVNEADPACWLFLSEFTPGPPDEGFPGWNYPNETGWQNSDFDTACNTADNALPGTERYVTGHQEAARIFAEELPILPLFQQVRIAVTRPQVRNLTVDPTQPSELWNLFAIDLLEDSP